MCEFPIVIEAVMVGVENSHAFQLEGDALDGAGVPCAFVAHIRGPGSGAAFEEIMSRVVSPIKGSGCGIETVMLKHAPGPRRRDQGDAQIAAPLMIGLHA